MTGQRAKTNREFSHAEMIERLFRERRDSFRDHPVFIETGCGLSTLAISKWAGALNGLAYSLDHNSQKIDDLKSKAGDRVANVQLLIGDSLENLPNVVAEHSIDFLFLDSAASALHTFREFLTCEPALKAGACVLVDNAALPNEKRLLSPVRKGKILVPYLLAAADWEVRGHPLAGDSMVSAIRHAEGNFADFAYEHPAYVDHWKRQFNEAMD